MEKTVTCSDFEHNLPRVRSGELPDEDAAPYREHLEACVRCARWAEVDEGFESALRRRLRRESAPAGLAERVREALAETQGPASFEGLASLESGAPSEVPSVARSRAWWSSPWAAAMAATVLLGAVLIVGLGDDDSLVQRTFHGIIVDRDCDQMGAPVAIQRDCDKAGHVNALKLEDGSYVHFGLEDAEFAGLAVRREHRGDTVTVSGTYAPAISTLQVARLDRGNPGAP